MGMVKNSNWIGQGRLFPKVRAIPKVMDLTQKQLDAPATGPGVKVCRGQLARLVDSLRGGVVSELLVG